ncbi:hypothetical protein [Rhodococcus koreensis]
MRAWERAGKRLPIDYTGPGFGGRAHRVRSPGHDLARPLEALRQIRAGEFRGVRWDYGDKHDVSVGSRFREVDSLPEAPVLWAQHLADLVTPMSLPMPGSSWLYELDIRALRTFAHEVYLGRSAGNGLNVRSGILTPSLSVIVTEVIVRTHVVDPVVADTVDDVLSALAAARAGKDPQLAAGEAREVLERCGTVPRNDRFNRGPRAIHTAPDPCPRRDG